MNVFIRPVVRIFSFGERTNVPFNSAIVSCEWNVQSFPSSKYSYHWTNKSIHYLYTVFPVRMSYTKELQK